MGLQNAGHATHARDQFGIRGVQSGLQLDCLGHGVDPGIDVADPGLVGFARLQHVDLEGLPLLQRLKVQPGMPVEVFVKTGERTLANYLLRPIKDNFKMALTEE